MFNRVVVKNIAKDNLVGNRLEAGIVFLVSLLFAGLLYWFDKSLGLTDPTVTDVSPIASLASSALSVLINGALVLATTKWYLDMSKNRGAITIGDFFGNFSYALKGILATLWQTLWLTIWSLLAVLPLIVILPVLFFQLMDSYTAQILPSNLGQMLLPVLACGLLAIVIAVVKGLAYSQMFFVIGDNPGISVRKAMRMSITMTKGYRLELFFLGLTFIGWFLLCIFTAGLALFYVVPYISATFAAAYLHIRDAAISKGLYTAEEFGIAADMTSDLTPSL